MSTIQKETNSIEKIIIILFIVVLYIWLCGCKATKPDGSLSWNTRHMNTVHKKVGGFYAGGKWIPLKTQSTVKK